MTDEKKYGTVIPVLFRDSDSREFWQGDPTEAPNEYEPVGWMKVGENTIYVDESALEVKTQIGKPEELLDPETLSNSSTKADIMGKLVNFFK